MKKPEINKGVSSAELAGDNSGDKPSWVQGRNCVYTEGSKAKYRVSVKALDSWKNYGYFNDLEVASYVANIAILNENCEERYQLNSVGNKNREELSLWRSQSDNRRREEIARDKYHYLQKMMRKSYEEDLLRREKVREKSKKAQMELEERQKNREREENDLIANAESAILFELLQRDISGDSHRKIRAELLRRKM